MLIGHTFHSFTRNDLRDTGPYVLSQFAGGMPPAIFLFLTGVTLAFLLDRRERQGAAGASRIAAGFRRAGYLLGIAFLFRLQLFAFGWPQTAWDDLWRVDILNCMGLAAMLMALLGAFQTAERVRFAAVLGLAISLASPLMSQADWSGVPVLVRSYLAPSYNGFPFFPWASFLAFGVSAGSLLRRLPPGQEERAMQWAALLGTALIFGGRYASDLPYSIYPKADFWLDSPALVAVKLGVICWLAAAAFVWVGREGSSSPSVIRTLGTQSLLVYWLHIELVYGRWLGAWKEQVSLAGAAGLAAAVTLLMIAAASVKSWRDKPETTPSWLRLYPIAPGRVAAD
jgi:uncharacterized membrane protein